MIGRMSYIRMRAGRIRLVLLMRTSTGWSLGDEQYAHLVRAMMNGSESVDVGIASM